jgi:hypothetical protein
MALRWASSRAFHPASRVASRLSMLDSRVARASSSRPSLMLSSPSPSYNFYSSSSTARSRSTTVRMHIVTSSSYLMVLLAQASAEA